MTPEQITDVERRAVSMTGLLSLGPELTPKAYARWREWFHQLWLAELPPPRAVVEAYYRGPYVEIAWGWQDGLFGGKEAAVACALPLVESHPPVVGRRGGIMRDTWSPLLRLLEMFA